MHKKANINLAKNLRKKQTTFESQLWYNIRDRRLLDLKFKRQVCIGNYIVDFCCHDKKIIIELDGSQHAENINDIERTKFLEKEGYKVLRFWNNEVSNSLNSVMELIAIECGKL
jgi:very-short-patch-repair endonuclease